MVSRASGHCLGSSELAARPGGVGPGAKPATSTCGSPTWDWSHLGSGLGWPWLLRCGLTGRAGTRGPGRGGLHFKGRAGWGSNPGYPEEPWALSTAGTIWQRGRTDWAVVSEASVRRACRPAPLSPLPTLTLVPHWEPRGLRSATAWPWQATRCWPCLHEPRASSAACEDQHGCEGRPTWVSPTMGSATSSQGNSPPSTPGSEAKSKRSRAGGDGPACLCLLADNTGQTITGTALSCPHMHTGASADRCASGWTLSGKAFPGPAG